MVSILKTVNLVDAEFVFDWLTQNSQNSKSARFEGHLNLLPKKEEGSVGAGKDSRF